MQNRPVRRLVLAAGAFGLLSCVGAGLWADLSTPAVPAGKVERSAEPATTSDKAAEKTADATAARPGSAAAAEYVEQAHQALARRSISADLAESITFGDQRFQATGKYLGQGLKLRLDLQIRTRSSVNGRMLEVCDGETLWSRTEVLDVQKFTRRDVRQILRAGEAGGTSATRLTAELGVGGLPGLMASLQRSLTFDAIKEEKTSAGRVVLVQGRWKDDVLARWAKESKKGIPDYVPDLVRIQFDATTRFPQRIAYLKRESEKKSYRPLMTMDFRNVVLDETLDHSLFDFVPPDGAAPEDTTRKYLDQIKHATDGVKAERDAAKP